MDVDPCMSLPKNVSDEPSWHDSQVFLREYLTQVGICDEAILDHSAGHSSNGNSASTPPTSRWYKFDDEFVHDLQYSSPSTVTPSNVNHVVRNASPVEQVIVSESAYLLFYRKRHLSKDNMIRYL
jgi:hypothetical protein